MSSYRCLFLDYIIGDRFSWHDLTARYNLVRVLFSIQICLLREWQFSAPSLTRAAYLVYVVHLQGLNGNQIQFLLYTIYAVLFLLSRHCGASVYPVVLREIVDRFVEWRTIVVEPPVYTKGWRTNNISTDRFRSTECRCHFLQSMQLRYTLLIAIIFVWRFSARGAREFGGSGYWI